MARKMTTAPIEELTVARLHPITGELVNYTCHHMTWRVNSAGNWNKKWRCVNVADKAKAILCEPCFSKASKGFPMSMAVRLVRAEDGLRFETEPELTERLKERWKAAKAGSE